MTRTHAAPGGPSAAPPARQAVDADPGLISESLEAQHRAARAELHATFDHRRGELSQEADAVLARVQAQRASDERAVH